MKFYNTGTNKQDMGMKLTSMDFFGQTNLSIVPHTLGILTANITCCIILLEYVNKSQVNVSIE